MEKTLRKKSSPLPLTKKSLHLLSRDALLDTRICDLPVDLNVHWIKRNVLKLNLELKRKGLKVIPHIWIADDWFSPDGVNGFAIPFFITHPRLIELEKEMMGEAEGCEPHWCMQLMRHEMGHALDNAFHLRRNKKRQKLFGLTTVPYPESYLPNKKSKDYVHHLKGHYAQAHPDEDWAETFALWLTPRSSWKTQYKGWNALAKLELVDELMKSLEGVNPRCTKTEEIDHFSSCTLTLREFYRRKRIRHKKNSSPQFKRSLEAIFTKQGNYPAWKLMEGQQRDIINRISQETDLHTLKIKKILGEVERTCIEKDLRYPQNIDSSKKKEMTDQLVHLIMDNTDRFFTDRSRHIIM